MYHDNPYKEGSLPWLTQKKTLGLRQHHKVFQTFSQEIHPLIYTYKFTCPTTDPHVQQPEANDWVQ